MFSLIFYFIFIYFYLFYFILIIFFFLFLFCRINAGVGHKFRYNSEIFTPAALRLLGDLSCHTPLPGPTRLANPNRFRGAKPYIWDSLPFFFS